jgi:hypothetical protein
VLLRVKIILWNSNCRYDVVDFRATDCYSVVAKFNSLEPELILFDRRVFVDSHGAGGGRNWVDPVTRHRNTGCCSERVAPFLRGLHDPLLLCREHYVFARIRSKCRRAKCEREHYTRAPNRRTIQATKPVFHSHAVIVIPSRIFGKLI